MMIEMSVQTEYGNIHVYKKGCGEKAVLLLHGGGADHAMLSWREVMGAFDESYSVFAPDLLGHGKSDSCDGMVGERFYDMHIDSIHQLAVALGLQRFVLAGLSMGGAIAIGYALRFPESVESLIPVASWGLSAKMPLHRLSYWYIHKTRLTLAQYRWLARSKWLAKWSIAYSLIGHKELITDALIGEVMAACQGDKAGKSMLDFQRSATTKDGTNPYYVDRLCELRMPVVYIAGENDPLVPKSDLENAAVHTPNGRFMMLPDCKHWSVKEMPQTLREMVNSLAEQ